MFKKSLYVFKKLEFVILILYLFYFFFSTSVNTYLSYKPYSLTAFWKVMTPKIVDTKNSMCMKH